MNYYFYYNYCSQLHTKYRTHFTACFSRVNNQHIPENQVNNKLNAKQIQESLILNANQFLYHMEKAPQDKTNITSHI